VNWRGCHASLRKDSPFYEIFNGLVPIKGIVAQKVKLIGDAETEAYMLAWAGCTDDQKIKIAETVTKLRGGTCDEFFGYMAKGGDMPIRVSQTNGATAPLSLFL
jgi:hypothetical protein